jgi:AraC-like DNA-binding protein
MEYVELAAPRPLDDLVRCFWFLRGEFPAAEPQTVVADGRVEIILHLADSFSIADDAGRLTKQDDALVSGQITRPVRLFGNGTGDVVGIRFRTAAAAAVLRVPLADLTNRVEGLCTVDRRLANGLLAAARRYQRPAARAAALSRILLAQVRRPTDHLVSTATRALEAGARIDGVARSVGATARTLERRVIAGTGLPPATLRRVMRFRRAFRLLDGAPPGTWAEVATQAGFADQSHMIRDFRQFAGCAPSEFFGADPDLARAIMGDEAAGDEAPGDESRA